MEKFAKILICLIPLVAFLLLLPSMLKGKKKDKTQKSTKPAVTEVKTVTETPAEVPPEQKMAEKNPRFDTPNFTKEDFKGYLKEKKKKVTAPVKKEEAKNNNFFESFSRYKQRQQAESQKQIAKPEPNILEDMGDLSPEVAALIFTNILDKKF